MLFDSAHNADCNCRANAELADYIMLDPLYGTDDYNPEEAYPGMVYSNIDLYVSSPLRNIAKDIVVMCFDYEGMGDKTVNGRKVKQTSEFGFGWKGMWQVCHIAP